jgi:hypothetical protein
VTTVGCPANGQAKVAVRSSAAKPDRPASDAVELPIGRAASLAGAAPATTAAPVRPRLTTIVQLKSIAAAEPTRRPASHRVTDESVSSVASAEKGGKIKLWTARVAVDICSLVSGWT